MKVVPTIAALTLAGAAALAVATGRSVPGDAPALSRLENPDRDTREKAASELKVSRQHVIDYLMTLARKPSKEAETVLEDKELAIELLGEYGAREAIGVLIEGIEYRVMTVYFEAIPAASHPCVRALSRIGVPSLKAIVVRCERECSDTELKLFADVFRLVDGDEMAILRAELAMKKADGQRKDNLEKLLALLKEKRWYF